MLLKKWVHTSSPIRVFMFSYCSAVVPKTGIVWSQMSRHTYIPWTLKLFLENVMVGCYEKGKLLSKWARVIVNLKKKNKREKKSYLSVVLRLRFGVEKVSSKHLWFQSPFLFILLLFPALLLYLFSVLPWLDHFSLQFYLHNHQTCYFFSNFFIFKFYSQRQIWLFCSKIIYFWGASVWKHSIVRSFPYLIIPVPHC